jgi:antitoxin component YwqK of YwqJK toxin-antitoxin module
MAANGTDTAVVEARMEKLQLDKASLEELQLARVVTRKAQPLCLINYSSDNDDSDADEDDGRLNTERSTHENGMQRHFRTYQNCVSATTGRKYQRIVEDKHFDTDGVCRLDVHFAIGSPYLSRKHYYPNQTLKSETLFWVDDEETMAMHKVGHWRTYYEGGNIKSEFQYRDGVRYGFCKRYAMDGAIEWVKDYTKDYLQRVDAFNEKKGNVALTVMESCTILGLDELPPSMKEVNSQYRTKCAPVHPDKTPDPDAVEEFLKLSRARDTIKVYFEKKDAGDAI